MHLRKGFADVVTALVVAVVSILVGVIIIGQLANVASGLGLTGSANTTVTNLLTQVWNSFGLLVILPIILVAAVVIGLVSGFGKGGRRR